MHGSKYFQADPEAIYSELMLSLLGIHVTAGKKCELLYKRG